MEMPSRNKRARTSNWGAVEKHVLINAIKSYINIIEDKRKLTSSNKQKEEAWRSIQSSLQIDGFSRDIIRIKEQWQRMKLQAKRNIKNFKKMRSLTGGGMPPVPPEDLDYQIADLVPYEFAEDKGNPYDCDGDHTNIELPRLVQDQVADNPLSTTISDPLVVEEQSLNNTIEVVQANYLETETLQTQITTPPRGTEGPSEHSPRPSQQILRYSRPTNNFHKKQKTSAQRKITEYEEKMLQLNKQKIEQAMKHAEEMHQLRMFYEKKYQEARILAVEKNTDKV